MVVGTAYLLVAEMEGRKGCSLVHQKGNLLADSKDNEGVACLESHEAASLVVWKDAQLVHKKVSY